MPSGTGLATWSLPFVTSSWTLLWGIYGLDSFNSDPSIILEKKKWKWKNSIYPSEAILPLISWHCPPDRNNTNLAGNCGCIASNETTVFNWVESDRQQKNHWESGGDKTNFGVFALEP